jgi:mannose-6-phosphate isomerase-like protein (cupin superfamily)
MDELDKGRRIALHGPEAETAAAEAAGQIREWDLTMPPVEPLVLDFGLGDFRRTGEIEYWIANETEAGYCGKFLFVFDGQTCPQHRHAGKHETFFVVKGDVKMVRGAETHNLREGGVLKVPPGVPHTFTGQGPALLLELSTPCQIDDNTFDDSRIPIGKKGNG